MICMVWSFSYISPCFIGRTKSSYCYDIVLCVIVWASSGTRENRLPTIFQQARNSEQQNYCRCSWECSFGNNWGEWCTSCQYWCPSLGKTLSMFIANLKQCKFIGNRRMLSMIFLCLGCSMSCFVKLLFDKSLNGSAGTCQGNIFNGSLLHREKERICVCLLSPCLNTGSFFPSSSSWFYP